MQRKMPLRRRMGRATFHPLRKHSLYLPCQLFFVERFLPAVFQKQPYNSICAKIQHDFRFSNRQIRLQFLTGKHFLKIRAYRIHENLLNLFASLRVQELLQKNIGFGRCFNKCTQGILRRIQFYVLGLLQRSAARTTQ